jgi:hypothetical protein
MAAEKGPNILLLFMSNRIRHILFISVTTRGTSHPSFHPTALPHRFFVRQSIRFCLSGHLGPPLFNGEPRPW